MKKKRINAMPRCRNLRRRVLIFRNFLMLCSFVFFALPMEGSAQQKTKVTVELRNVSLDEVISELRKQTDYDFFYNTELAKSKKNVNVAARDKQVTELLNEILPPLGMEYAVQGDMISIRAKEKVQEQTIESKRITGTVTDSKGNVLPGVTVLVKGTTIGTATDVDGKYAFTLPKGDHVLVFSMIGMQPYEISIGSRSEINVVLQEDVAEMDEVVVTGIFSKAKESYTGAVSVITEKELKSFGNRNLLTTLRNIDPSFNIIENNEFGSDPNHLPEIQIRGGSSMPDIDQLQSETSAELNTPLIIMDGFEISLQRMMDLDDNEVKSITILKDASATAIYGSRGANGVVVIETKEPEPGKLKLTYTGSLNVEVPDLSDYHVLNAREKLDLEFQSGYYNNEMPIEDILLKKKYSSILQDVERGVDTYWLSKPLRTGIGHRHNVKLEGGDPNFRYSATLQYNHIAGVMKESLRNNFNGGINLSYKTSNLIFRNSLTISLNKAQESPYGTFDQYVKLNPYWTDTDENGNQKKFFDEDYRYWNGSYPANPLYNATLNTRETSDYTNITNNFSIEWKPVQELTLRGTFGIYTQQNNNDRYLPPEHTSFANYTDENAFRKGSYRYGTGKTSRWNLSFTANYSKVFADAHMIYAGFNMDLENNDSYNYSFNVEGFPSGAIDFLSVAMSYAKDGKPGGSQSQSRRVGFVGNVSYSFEDRYFVDASFRTDGSSLYGADRRFAPFWSTGIGWNIHRENFMQNVLFIDRLKIRGSIGETGSNNFSAYEAVSTYAYNLNDRYYQWMGANLRALANPKLEWQKTMKYDAGVELNVFNSRVSIIGDIYLERTNSLMSSLELPPSNGFSSYKANIGKLENKGFELKATAFILRDTEKELIWSVTGYLVHNKDKILELSEAMKESNEALLATGGSVPNKVWQEGDSQNAIYVVPSLGIDPSTGKELYLKKNGEVTYTWDARDRVYSGVDQPKYRGNLNTMFRWKDLSVNMSFGYEWGGQTYNETLINRVENADKKYNVDERVYEDRWKQPGDVTFFKGINVTTSTQATSRFVQDEATFSCQNINITYEFRDNKWLKHNLGLQNLTLQGNMADIFRISTIKQERGTSYPFSRQFSFSLSAMF